MAQLLTRTSLQGLRPVGAENRRAHEAYEFLRNYVEQTLGPGSGAFLAEPVADGDGVLWYVDSDAPATALSRLPPDRQDRLLAMARKQIDALSAASGSLAQSRNADQARMGEMLNAALQTGGRAAGAEGAGTDLLYEVDGRPVLVGWGLREDVPNPPDAPLVTYLSERQARLRRPDPAPPPPAAAQTPPPPPPPEPERDVVVRYDWVTPSLWALFIALMVAIYTLLFAACGLISGSGWLGYCEAPAQAAGREDELAALIDEGGALQAALAQARARGDRIEACAPTEPMTPIPADAPAPDQEIEERREAAGGASGDVTITLIWDDPADLDLHLNCPNGQRVFFGQKAACGGLLDVDANAGSEALAEPIENIVLSHANAPTGVYRVRVNNFAARKSRVRPTPFVVQITFRDSGDVQRYEGVVDEEQTVDVTRFTLR